MPQRATVLASIGAILLAGTSGAARGATSPGHAVAIFIAQLGLMLLAGRGLGELAQRIGQPAVIGQLVAGVLLGPSVLGLVPGVSGAIFPATPEQRAMIEGLAQLGVLLLLLLSGMETDLRLLRRIRRTAFFSSACGMIVPFVLGVLVAQWLPESVLPDPHRRTLTALFVATCLAVSSVKIVAMIILESGFQRRDLGQVILATAVVDDTVGWIAVGAIAGAATRGGFDAGAAAGRSRYSGGTPRSTVALPRLVRVVADAAASRQPGDGVPRRAEVDVVLRQGGTGLVLPPLLRLPARPQHVQPARTCCARCGRFSRLRARREHAALPARHAATAGADAQRRSPPDRAGLQPHVHAARHPVLRYGDELGMGDNLDLPERTCARTPMQWSTEPNGGFTTADKPVVAVISEGPYGYQHVNAAQQRREPSSMLNWTERIVRMRKEVPEVGWGGSSSSTTCPRRRARSPSRWGFLARKAGNS